MWEFKLVSKTMKTLLSILLLVGGANAFAQQANKDTEHKADRRKMAEMTLQKLSSELPQAKPLQAERVAPRDVTIIKPPRSSNFFKSEGDPLKAEYNKLIDEEINKLYKLSQKYKTSRSRGEIWLRLAQAYVEKGKVIEFKSQDDYDKKVKLWEQKKLATKPVLPKAPGKSYYLRAIQAYEWFIRDFPKDPKVPQALYFLGYSNFETGNEKKGEAYYRELTERYPSSVYVDESHFALGEYYFEKEQWTEALEHYGRLIQKKSPRLYGFSLYKSAWCQYRMGKHELAVETLEKVIRMGGNDQEAAEGIKEINTLRLREEAIKDYVAFYSQTGKYQEAQSDFYKSTGNEKKTVELLDALAYRYSYSGNVPASTYLFKKLIAIDPDAEKAAKYQYQIVQDNLNINNLKNFKAELAVWIEQYGPDSSWAKKNAGKPEMVTENFNLQETTLRNHTLRLHQTAVSVKTEFSRQVAADSYKMYLTYFKNSPKHSEMRFFYAELLFDMREYEKAATQYQWVAENDKKSPYYEKSVINNVLAMEKLLPRSEQMEANRKNAKDKTTKIPYEPSVKKFEQACLLYLAAFPKGEKAPEIRKRLGDLYYVHNDYEPALAIFRGILKDTPNSKDAPTAAEYILDIHNQRNDIDAYQKEAVELLNNPTIAKSPVGKEIKENLNKVSFLKADTLSKGGKNIEAGSAFEAFSKTHAGSPQAFTAMFNAAINYEKGGDLPNAQRMYEQMLTDPSTAKNDVGLKQDARAALAEIYRKTGQLEKAAVAYEQSAKSLSGPKSVAATNNAAILWMALGRTEQANAAMNVLDKATKKESEKTDRMYDRAEMFYAKKDFNKAVYYYDEFLKAGWRDANKCMRAMYLIGDIYAKQNKHAQAKQWFEKAVGYSKERGMKAGPKYASQAKFWLTHKLLDDMRAVRLGTSEKTITNGLKQMKDTQAKMVKDLKEVIRYDYGPMIVAALAAEAESYEIISKAFSSSPVPREYAKPEEQKQYRELAGKEAATLLATAKDKYKGAFDRGLSLEAYGQPLLDAAHGYHRLEPGDTKNGGEITNVGNILDRVGL